MEINKEIWKDIAGYECLYQISNFGNVKSLNRTILNCGVHLSINVKSKILKFNVDKDGYNTVCLNFNGNAKRFKIHRLVAITFIENTENKRFINHIDSCRNNNNVSNLEWVTIKENTTHAFNFGLRTMDNVLKSRKKLSIDQVKEIRANNSKSAKELSIKYNVTCKCIYSILSFKTWEYAN